MDNKKIKKPRKQRDKKTKNKNKNKNTQSIKINISSSGGLGGSGGGGVPSSIPIPVQSFARSEKIGENVEVSNLLKRIENQQQNVFTNLMNQQQTAFNNLMFQRPEEINRDDKIDEAERINKNDMVEQAENINNGIDGDDKNIFSTSMLSPSSSPFLERKPDNSNLSLIQSVEQQQQLKVDEKNEEKKEDEDVGGGGGGGSNVNPFQNLMIPPLKQYDTYIEGMAKGKYRFTFRNKYKGESRDSMKEAQEDREQFFLDNNITFKN